MEPKESSKDLDGLAVATEARDQAMAKAEGGASYEWLAEAESAIRLVSSRKELFTADDVWDTGLEIPRESRALGPVFMKMKRDGIIAPTDMFKLTKRRLRHAAPIRVWKSLVRPTA